MIVIVLEQILIATQGLAGITAVRQVVPDVAHCFYFRVTVFAPYFSFGYK